METVSRKSLLAFSGYESNSGKRVIRHEPGKIAEIFTLVIAGTVEENWFNNSSSGNNYIEITEEELDDVLRGENFDDYTETAKEDLQFRF